MHRSNRICLNTSRKKWRIAMILGGGQQREPTQYSFVKWRKVELTGQTPTKSTGSGGLMPTKFKIIVQVCIVQSEMGAKKVPLPVNVFKNPHAHIKLITKQTIIPNSMSAVSVFPLAKNTPMH